MSIFEFKRDMWIIYSVDSVLCANTYRLVLTLDIPSWHPHVWHTHGYTQTHHTNTHTHTYTHTHTHSHTVTQSHSHTPTHTHTHRQTVAVCVCDRLVVAASLLKTVKENSNNLFQNFKSTIVFYFHAK